MAYTLRAIRRAVREVFKRFLTLAFYRLRLCLRLCVPLPLRLLLTALRNLVRVG